MRVNERAVKYFDCKVKATVRGAKGAVANVPPLSMTGIMQELAALLNASTPISISGTGEYVTWSIGDVHLEADGSKAMFVIHRADRLGADQAIMDMGPTGTWRVASKDATEGNAFSAHVAIRLTPDAHGAYLLLLEDCPGVSSDKVARLLSLAVKRSIASGSNSFLYPNPQYDQEHQNRKQLLKGHYKFEIVGHPSRAFEDELNAGRLNSVEIVNATITGHAFGGYNSTDYIASVVKLKPLASNSSNIDRARAWCTQARIDGMTEVRIRFTDDEDDTRSVSLDPTDARLINEERYVKKAYIRNFSGRLDTGASTIHPEIRAKMFYLLR